jgi:UDP-GlcNAc:undecaprenyl-phosphate/decaprenyl-phosphate GlcNAc-1-phosphate transferase
VIPLVIFALALVASFAGTPLVMRAAQRWGAVDRPDEGRRRHHAPTPKLGGVALAIGFFLALIASFLLPVARHDAQESMRVTGLVIGLLIVLAIGVYDDLRELSATPQFLVQFVAAGIIIVFGVRIEDLSTPVGTIRLPDWFAVVFTFFWLVGMMNTVNWLDGLDGLAAGVVAIACAILFVHTQELGQESIALLPLALLAALVGFLPFNFSPAKIFLGASGALFIGLALGTLSIIGSAKVASALLVVGIPVLDTAWQIVRRIRDGRAPYHGDRGHLHFRLVDRGIPQRQVVLMLYALTALFGGMALALPSPTLKLLAMLVMGIVALGTMLWLTRQSSKQ